MRTDFATETGNQLQVQVNQHDLVARNICFPISDLAAVLKLFILLFASNKQLHISRCACLQLNFLHANIANVCFSWYAFITSWHIYLQLAFFHGIMLVCNWPFKSPWFVCFKLTFFQMVCLFATVSISFVPQIDVCLYQQTTIYF